MSVPIDIHQPSRNVGLDLLRLVAVLLVLFRHSEHAAGSNLALDTLRVGGWIGVDVFFVLSGFLVSGLLFREHQQRGHARIGRFLVRRGLKIYPAFWVWLAFMCLTTSPGPRGLAGEVLFLQNYAGLISPHTWSLAIEEHFYLGLAVLVYVLQRRGLTAIPRVFAVVAVACLALRVLTAWREPAFDWYRHVAPTHLRVDSLFLGVWLSYGIHYHRWRERTTAPRWLLTTAGMALLAPAFYFDANAHRWVSVIGLNVFAVGSALLLIAVLDWHPPRAVRALANLGAASYSIYLWHLVVQQYARHATTNDATYLVVYLFGAVAVGAIMARLVEWPVLRLRDHLTSREHPTRHHGVTAVSG